MMPTAVSPGPCHARSHRHSTTAQLTCTDEARLMRRIAAGDQQAFETLYTHYAPRLAGFLGRFLVSPALADEVLNEVMLTLWQQAAHFDPRRRLSSWLLGIARHRAITAHRQATRHADAGLPPAPDWDDDEDPEGQVTRQEHARKVAQALYYLPPEQRQVIEWTYYQGCSAPEIAVRTGDPVPTVKARLRRAHGRLARLLGECEQNHTLHLSGRSRRTTG